MEKKRMIQIVRSVKGTLMAHPDNEENSEFADRISSLEELEQALSMYGVSDSVPNLNREKKLEESLSVLLGMASTWGREWFKSETWDKVEKAREVLAGTNS